MRVLDAVGMYPAVNVLMGIRDLLIAKRIGWRRGRESVKAFAALAQRDDLADALFEPQNWRLLTCFVLIRPDSFFHPTRLHYDDEGAYELGFNPHTSDTPRWLTGADYLVGILRSGGPPPPILDAVRLYPVGRQDGLKAVRLRGDVVMDPRERDPFQVIVEEQHRLKQRSDLAPKERKRIELLLKTMRNSGSYGIYGQINRQTLPVGQKADVRIWCGEPESFTARTPTPETPGPYCFPPIAALIPGAARLMLALLERCVRDAGGSYLFCDTDSDAVVASPDGELIPCTGGLHHMPDGRPAVLALSYADLEAIRQRFRALNPYDQQIVPGPLFRLEDENFAPCQLDGHERDCVCTQAPEPLYGWAISAKRYCLFNQTADGRIALRKFSEHGLGGIYMDPRDPSPRPDPREGIAIEVPDEGQGEAEPSAAVTPAKGRRWIAEAWEVLVREALDLPTSEPSWIDQVAVSRLTVSSPALLQPFAKVNEGRPRERQIRPFNFVMLAHPVDEFTGSNVSPMAPFETDPERWEPMTWYDRYTGRPIRIQGSRRHRERLAGGFERVTVHTYRSILRRYKHHPEAKSLGPDGEPCSGTTRGVLQPRPVESVGLPVVIGKEGNDIEEVALGLRRRESDVLNTYRNPEREVWRQLVVPVLRDMPVEATARAVGISGRRFLAIRSSAVSPHTGHQLALAWAAIMFAQSRLSGRAIPVALISTQVRDASLSRGRIAPEGLANLKHYAEERPRFLSRERQCSVSGETFVAGARARYCSARCRKRARRSVESPTRSKGRRPPLASPSASTTVDYDD